MTAVHPEPDVYDRLTAKESRWLIVIVVAGTVLRALLLMTHGTDLRTDTDAYLGLSDTVVQTGGLCSPGTSSPTAFRPPLYPIALAAIKVLGIKSTVAVGLISVLSGAVVMISAWWMSRLIGLRGIWPGIATIAAAVDPLLLRYSVLPMTEAPAAALLAVAILQMLKLLPAAGNAGLVSPTPVKSALVAGVFFGLAGLCRPICFVACGLLTVALVIRHGIYHRRITNTDVASVGRAVPWIPACVALLLLAPWVVRNAVQFQAFVPLTTHGGYTLLLGNNPAFYEDVVLSADQGVWPDNSFDRWEHQWQDNMKADNVVGEPAKDRWMYARAQKHIVSMPKVFLQACALRWRRFWALSPQVEGQSLAGVLMWGMRGWYLLQWIGLILTVLLCLRNDRIAIMWMSAVAFLLVHSIYWTNTRMRAPLTAVIVVLMAKGWQQLETYCRRQWQT